MQYKDLREFMDLLSRSGELKQIDTPVSLAFELTGLADRVLRAGGPALLLRNARDVAGRAAEMPVLANLFGSTKRVALAMGQEDPAALREIGRLLAYLKEPDPPRGLRDAWAKWPVLKQVLNMAPKEVSRPACQAQVLAGSDVDLGRIPIQHCWPGDIAPLITWGLVVTRGPGKPRQNLGIYRQQMLNERQTIMRWLSHRGGALDFQDHAAQQKSAGAQAEPFPLAVVLGADPATILGAVTPVPDSLSEYQFAGLLRGARTSLARCGIGDLQVPESAEIVLEGVIRPDPDGSLTREQQRAAQDRLTPGTDLPACPQTGWEMAPEGPYGDHTGYYNEIDWFPVFTIERITMRDKPLYLTTYTGRPPDEPAMLGVALNEVFVPILQKQFPEIVDFYLPPEGCSYRLAVVSMRKQYAGHAKRVMFGIWSFLRQFMYTKFIIVTDDDIDVRDWQSVIWAMTTRVDPARDSTLVHDTPIDYLDFASPVSGLGSKIGIDATNKWPGETQREWGRPITMDAAIEQRVDALMRESGLGD